MGAGRAARGGMYGGRVRIREWSGWGLGEEQGVDRWGQREEQGVEWMGSGRGAGIGVDGGRA